MFVRPRLRILIAVLVIGAFGAGSLTGCRKGNADAAKKASALNPDAVKKDIGGLKAPIDGLATKFKYLHSEFDPLPPNLPGFEDVRAKFYGTDEVVGRMGSKMTWLSERADAAAKSGNRQELELVSKEVAQTHDDMRQLDRIATELIHQVLPFKRLAKELATDTGGTTF